MFLSVTLDPLEYPTLYANTESRGSSVLSSASLSAVALSRGVSPPYAVQYPATSVSSGYLVAPVSKSIDELDAGFAPSLYSNVSYVVAFFSPLNGIAFAGRPSVPVLSTPPYTVARESSVLCDLCFVRLLPRFGAGVFVILFRLIDLHVCHLTHHSHRRVVCIIGKTTTKRIVRQPDSTLRSEPCHRNVTRTLGGLVTSVPRLRIKYCRRIHLSYSNATEYFLLTRLLRRNNIDLRLAISDGYEHRLLNSDRYLNRGISPLILNATLNKRTRRHRFQLNSLHRALHHLYHTSNSLNWLVNI